MNESAGYAVFFFAPALEALGDAIKPYLQEGPAGPHVPCREVDTAGAFIELTLEGRTPEGREVELELMVPGNMVRMIVSARSDGDLKVQQTLDTYYIRNWSIWLDLYILSRTLAAVIAGRGAR